MRYLAMIMYKYLCKINDSLQIIGSRRENIWGGFHISVCFDKNLFLQQQLDRLTRHVFWFYVSDFTQDMAYAFESFNFKKIIGIGYEK